MFKLVSKLRYDVDDGMDAAIKSKDPQKVVNYMKENAALIKENPRYIPLLVRVLRDFQSNLDANVQTLDLIHQGLDYTTKMPLVDSDGYIKTLYTEGGLKQILENMNHFLENQEIASKSLSIFEKASKNSKICSKFFSDTETLRTIFLTMSGNKREYAKVCGKGVDIFLNVAEKSRGNAEIFDRFSCAGVISILSTLIQNAAHNKRNPSKSIKVLSLLNPTEDSLKKAEGQIKEALLEIFEGIKKFIEEGENQPQGFLARETILHTFTFTAKMAAKSMPIQKYFIEKGYISILVDIISRFSEDKEILTFGINAIASFNFNDKDVKKAFSEPFLEFLSKAIELTPPPEALTSYLKTLHLIVKDDTEVSTEVINSGLAKRIFEIMAKYPKDKDVQEQGFNVVLTTLFCAPDRINDDSGINLISLFDCIKEHPQKEFVRKSAVSLVGMLNDVSLNSTNVLTMMGALNLAAKYYEEADEKLEKRYEEFRTMDNNNNIIKMDANGGANVFIESIKAFINNDRVVSPCLAVLSNMLYLKKSTPNKSTLTKRTLKKSTPDNFASLGGVKSVLDAMKAHSKDGEIQRLCCNIFVNMASKGGCTSAFYSENGIELVIEAMNNHVTHEKVQQWGSYVIINYIRIPLFKQKLEKGNAFFAITRALRNFPGCPKIQNFYCSYMSTISPSESVKTLVKKYKCHENALNILKEENIAEPYIGGFNSYCHLIMNFGVADIPDDKSLGIEAIILYMNYITQENYEQKIGITLSVDEKNTLLKNGMDTILKILHFRRCVQDDLNKESFVSFAINVSKSDPRVAGTVKKIFSLMDFVQDKDVIKVDILKQIIDSLGKEKRNNAFVEACLVLLSRLAVLKGIVDSPLMEDVVRTVTNIEKGDTSAPTQACCLLALGKIGYTGGTKIRWMIINNEITWNIKTLLFKDEQWVETTFTFILCVEKFNYATRNKVCDTYAKSILEAIRNKELTTNARRLGYEIISDLSLFLKLQKELKEDVLLPALNFLIDNFENDTFIKTSGILNLVVVDNKGSGKLSETVKTMLADRDNPDVQVKGCKDVFGEKVSAETKDNIVACGLIETLFLAILTHRNNRDVVTEACRALAYIGKSKVDKFERRFVRLRLGKVLMPLLAIHQDSEEAVSAICEAICVVGRWTGIDVDEVRARVLPKLMDNPQIALSIEEMKKLKKSNNGTPSKQSKTQIRCAKGNGIVSIRTIDDLKSADCETIAKWVRQLGLKNTRNVQESVKKNEVIGETLCCLESAEKLVKLYNIPSDDAQTIFNDVESIKGRISQVTKKTSKFAQEDYSGEGTKFDISKYGEGLRYETLEESLESAGFERKSAMLKYSRELTEYNKRHGLLEKLGLTMADAMALTIYTYDNGQEHFDDNPYRKINIALGERSTSKAIKIKGYVLRLLAALRKLPSYESTKPLYRAVTNLSENLKKVGNVLTWPAFTSTSSDEDSVIDFIDNIAVGGAKYILEITGCFKKGHSIKDFSFHPEEDEILFEPETKFRVVEVKEDPELKGVTRIFVNIIDTDPVLAKAIESFEEMCKKNIDKENFSCSENAKQEREIRAYSGPITTYFKWDGFWNSVKEGLSNYMGLKEALLGLMDEGKVRKMLVDGYKKDIIDDYYCDGADMMKGYQVSVEEGAALYSCTYKYGEKEGGWSPSSVVGEKIKKWLESGNGVLGSKKGALDARCANYLLHIHSGLDKLPLWGDVGATEDDNGQKESKDVYFLIKDEDAIKLESEKEYILGSIFAGCVERPGSRDGTRVVCVKDAQNLCLREVGPLSAWGNVGYVLGLPGAHVAVVTPPTKDGAGDIVLRGIRMGAVEKSACDKCSELFISASLPKDWSVEKDDNGRTFYQDNATDKTQWARPTVDDPEFFTCFDISRIKKRPSPPSTVFQSTPTSSMQNIEQSPSPPSPVFQPASTLSIQNTEQSLSSSMSFDLQSDLTSFTQNTEQSLSSTMSFDSQSNPPPSPPQQFISSTQQPSFMSFDFKPTSTSFIPSTQQPLQKWSNQNGPTMGNTYYANTNTVTTQQGYPQYVQQKSFDSPILHNYTVTQHAGYYQQQPFNPQQQNFSHAVGPRQIYPPQQQLPQNYNINTQAAFGLPQSGNNMMAPNTFFNGSFQSSPQNYNLPSHNVRSPPQTQASYQLMPTKSQFSKNGRNYSAPPTPPQQATLGAQKLPPNWIAQTDRRTGRTYYANTVTKMTQWGYPQK